MAWEGHCFLPEQNRTKIGRDMGRPMQLAQKMIFVRLWLSWKALQSLLRQIVTCRPIGSCCVRAMLSAKQQRLCTRVKLSWRYYKRGVHFSTRVPGISNPITQILIHNPLQFCDRLFSFDTDSTPVWLCVSLPGGVCLSMWEWVSLGPCQCAFDCVCECVTVSVFVRVCMLVSVGVSQSVRTWPYQIIIETGIVVWNQYCRYRMKIVGHENWVGYEWVP